MSTAAVDLTKMSAAEIKAFIESQNLTEPVEQPRDEQGRFVSTSESEPTVEGTEETQTEAEPVVVEREIDLADGSGVQVFRGVGATEQEALAALADELVQAQANATKKIRELSQVKPAAQLPAQTPEQVAANEFLLAQQLMDKPRETIREVLKQEFGLTAAEIREKLAAAAQVQRNQHEDAVANAFMAANPDYAATPQNATRLLRQLQIDNLPTSVDNLQKVYNSLKAEGLIAPAPETVDTVSNRPRSSGLSTRSTSTPPPPKAVDTSKLTLDQLRELSGGYQTPRF